ncbi:hypothetical protein [Solidesulfovibrio carbinoliphilus]|uniref:hypothetical protein n=1 Tax=Solidesulfovibrio carbinoliphilus TaxID=345370 RepID=UPI0012F4BA64|nr:hypothetical protein [Solidesulfovibrio carbinoliphilus]
MENTTLSFKGRTLRPQATKKARRARRAFLRHEAAAIRHPLPAPAGRRPDGGGPPTVAFSKFVHTNFENNIFK